MLEQLIPFLIASALGLMIGIERERRNFKELQALGVRTFILLGLLGALAGYTREAWLAAVIALFVGAAIIASYVRTSATSGEKSGDVGLTTEMAAAATFALGFFVHKNALLCAILGVLVLVILISRSKLHHFSRYQLQPNEIQAAVILFVLAIGILPLLPEAPIDPWGLFSLKRFVTIVTLIAGVEFAGYVAMRVFGSAIGIPLSGFLAGFISSTAAFLTLPALVKKQPSLVYTAASGALFASASTLLFLLGIVAFASPELLALLWPAVTAAIAICMAAAFILARNSKSTEFSGPKNPISLRATLKLSLFLMAVIVAVGAMQKFAGTASVPIASFVAGLAELHGVTFATATLYVDKKIDSTLAHNSILLAVAASICSKLAITWVLNHGRYALVVSTSLVVSLIGLGLTWWLV